MNSLFQITLGRVSDRETYTDPIIITHSDYRFLVAEQALEMDAQLAGVLLEPVARNTAMAIAAAAVYALKLFGPDAILHILPSDHDIGVGAGYDISVQLAANAARAGKLATFGIRPTFAETGYGYIKFGPPIADGYNSVERFVEKPDRRSPSRCCWMATICGTQGCSCLAPPSS